MTQSTLGQWERGDPPTAFPLLAKLARHYDVSADWLLGLTDDRAPAAERDLPDGAPDLLETARAMSPQGLALLARIAEDMLAYERQLSADLTQLDMTEAIVKLFGDAQTWERLGELSALFHDDPTAAEEGLRRLLSFKEETQGHSEKV